MAGNKNKIVPPPLYQTRVEDMEDDHVLLLERACSHRGYLTKRELMRHPRIHGYEKILGLPFYLRCSLCRKRGLVKITLQRPAPF